MRVGAGVDLEHEVDDVLQGDIGGVRRVPAAPAGVVAHAVLRNAFERPVRRLDTHVLLAPVLLVAGVRVNHALAVAQAGVVDLEDEARINDGLEVVLDDLGQREAVLFFRLVVLIPDEVVEPAGAENGVEVVLVCRRRPPRARP